MNDLTVVYYTANREADTFERKIREALLSAIGDLPLISVSQKPLTGFGTNICVGDVGRSSHNAFRQLQVGCQQATTRFVCTAESDFLYPPEYFAFRPPSDDLLYLALPIYIVVPQRGYSHGFFPKRHAEGAMVSGRDFLLTTIQSVLGSEPLWKDGIEGGQERGEPIPCLLTKGNRTDFSMSIPAISFRTDEQMHRRTPFIRGQKVARFPHWGTPGDLMSAYC